MSSKALHIPWNILQVPTYSAGQLLFLWLQSLHGPASGASQLLSDHAYSGISQPLPTPEWGIWQRDFLFCLWVLGKEELCHLFRCPVLPSCISHWPRGWSWPKAYSLLPQHCCSFLAVLSLLEFTAANPSVHQLQGQSHIVQNAAFLSVAFEFFQCCTPWTSFIPFLMAVPCPLPFCNFPPLLLHHNFAGWGTKQVFPWFIHALIGFKARRNYQLT